MSLCRRYCVHTIIVSIIQLATVIVSFWHLRLSLAVDNDNDDMKTMSMIPLMID